MHNIDQKSSCFLLLIVFTNVCFPFAVSSELLTIMTAPNSCSLKIGLKFLNFDPQLELDLLADILPSSIDHSSIGHSHTKYELIYDIETLDSSINDSIKTYWDANAPLQDHPHVAFDPSLHGESTDVFVNRTGRQVDARKFEQWLPSVVPTPTTDYTLYIFNLTYLDRDGYDHWFSLTVNDPDANITTTGFYSLTTGLYTRPVTGFGGNVGRFYFLDLSAYHWYPTFIETVWNWDAEGYLFSTIQEIVEQYGAETASGQESIRYWIGHWIIDILGNNFIGYIEPPYIISEDKPIVNPKVDIEVLLLSNLTDKGYPLDSLQWLTSEKRILTPLMEVAPFYQWNVTVRLEPLNTYPDLFRKFNSEAQAGNGIIEVTEGFFDFVDNFRQELFPTSNADISFPTVGFLSNETEMANNGLIFAGISRGFPWQLLNLNPSRLYKFNNTSNRYDVPDRGLTQVIVHEVGHTLGFPHPHDYYGWGGDYVESVMSYYNPTVNFSTYAIDRFSRSSTDIYFDYYKNASKIVNQLLEEVSSLPIEDENKLQSVQKQYEDSIQAYDHLEYQQAYENISLAVTLQYEITSSLQQLAKQSSSTSTSSKTPGWAWILLLFSLFGISYLKKRKRVLDTNSNDS